jgi:hypothetical protein
MKRFKAQQVYVSFILLIFGVLLIAGCGGSDEVALLRAERDPVNPGTCTEAVGPFVISSNLIDGDNPVPINTLITATFSEAMNPTTIEVTNSGNPQVLTFTLKAHNQVDNVHGTVTMNDPLNTIATFKPDAALDINTQYTATITKYARSASNNSELSCSYRWSFTTGT